MPTWTVLVPVRSGSSAKSRLGAPSGLAAAIAEDTLAAAAACPSVGRLVVLLAGRPPRLPERVEILPQPGEADGLRAGIEYGLATLAQRRQTRTSLTAVLLADLAALTPEALGVGLERARRRLAGGAPSAHIPDATGRGTVLLAGLRPDGLPVRFGPGSAAAHAAAGSAPLTGLPLPLTRDIDTAGDLLLAWTLGVGPRTRARLAPVQVTVLDYDTHTGAGHVVTDEGLRLPLPASALDGSGLRFVRPGQRLSALLDTDGDGRQNIIAARLDGIGTALPDPAGRERTARAEGQPSNSSG